MENDMGLKIATILRQQKMRQKDLAARTGITESAISKYISGKMTPRADTLTRIAAALHTSSDYLIGVGTGDTVEAVAADVVQVRCGRWEHTCTAADRYLECLKCSVCGLEDTKGYYFSYCPNCGAKMNV